MKSSLTFMFNYLTKKRWFILGYLALVLECVTPIVAILLQRDLIDQVFIGKHYDKFTQLILLYAIFYFGPKLWFTVRKVVFFHISYLLQMTLTEAFILKIYEMPTVLGNKEHVGKLLNHIRHDIADACDLTVNKVLSDLIMSLLSVVLLTILLVKINLLLLFLVTLIAFVYYVLLNKFGMKTKDLAQRVREEKANVSITIEENISSLKEVTAYNRQKWQLNHYEKRFDHYFSAIIKESLYKVKLLFVSDPFLYMTKLVVILLGALSVMLNKSSLGGFVVSFTLVDQLVVEVGNLFNQALTGKKLGAAVTCLQSIMTSEKQQFGNVELTGTITSIQFKNVIFSYSPESHPILNDISLVFPVGKKIAIVGESGSGKSTISNLLLRAYSPDSGEVCINNVSLNEYDERYTDKMSVVFQEPHFIPSTIRENLMFDQDYTQLELEMICREMLCHEFIESFPKQYETLVGERGVSLSGGQKQRLALARALLKNTDILILDEATSALDNETEFRVQKNLDKLRVGKTTIIIAHRISTIQNSDIIFVLDKGQVVSQGTHETLMEQSPIYQRLYLGQQATG